MSSPKKKTKISVNNKMKGAFGKSEFVGKKPTGKIEINVRAHKGDRRELASTVKHELMHVKHPKMTEKEVYKRTAKTKIAPAEQAKLLAKLRDKKLNYKAGAIKRRLGMTTKAKLQPGDLITKANASKQTPAKEVLAMNPTKRTATLGMM